MDRPNWVFDSLVRRANSPSAQRLAELLSCRMRCQALNKADRGPPLPLPEYHPLSFVEALQFQLLNGLSFPELRSAPLAQ